jgi:hypothetical protein
MYIRFDYPLVCPYISLCKCDFFTGSIPPDVPQILINREPLPHFSFDVELLGDSDVVINQICHMYVLSYRHIRSIAIIIKRKVDNIKIVYYNVCIIVLLNTIHYYSVSFGNNLKTY